MHSAPSVVYPLGRSSWERWLYTGFIALTGAVCCVWAILQPLTLWQGWAGIVWLAAVFLGRHAWRQNEAQLLWDGEHWWFYPTPAQDQPEVLGDPTVTLDFQGVLLLKWPPPSRPHMLKTRWLWLRRQDDPTRWQDIRRAVYARTQSL